MDWGLAKDILAVWGGLLSTILVTLRFVEDRPVVTLSAVSDFGDMAYQLVVFNPSRHPILVRKIDYWPSDREKFVAMFRPEHWETRNEIKAAMNNSALNVCIGAGHKLIFETTVSDPPPYLCLALSWRRQGSFVLPRFPRVLYRTGRQLAEMAAHPTKEAL